MSLTKDQALVQELRNAILLEADYLDLHAEMLDACSSTIAPAIAKKRLATAAIGIRARAKMLHDVLAASEPKAEATQE